ncbi:hypothetical protein H3H37_01235 [Duganella sp. LX20W]|uniref:Uncharacterized protein n=1 Tax=Rugamonas brunnea TaxID=2758569 RepID=A0A7W2ENN1_9BURK|nr:hypothetical protein [Rugamonas brunnea]MBA5635675.1 hypothetical protein [Rugamonas brunnea]
MHFAFKQDAILTVIGWIRPIAVGRDFEELLQLHKFILALSFSLVIAFSTAAPIVSGNFDGLLVGVDQQGTLTKYLTKYFESSTGNGQFSCIFFMSGKLDNLKVRVDSWFPADRDPHEVVRM